ncbi:MAG: hypothetical protein MJ009_07925, partial [Paludibacteraceae bacterium]|nr:hypothetical protein [Paludibacteraceae bacterium]
LSSSGFTYFFFCLPANTLASGFTIEMEDADGKTATIDYTGTDKKVEQGKGKTLEVPDVEFKEPTTGYADRKEGTGTVKVKWVQLWEDGPKFAEYNVGATSVEEYGGYYRYGGSQDKGDDYFEAYESPLSIHDTAKNLWGDNWKMPTGTDFSNLFSNCIVTEYYGDDNKYEGKNGLLFTGKDDYSGNSVFFHAAGNYNDGEIKGIGQLAAYWDSDVPEHYDCTFGCGLFSYTGNLKVHYSMPRIWKISVRAILNE